MAILTDIEAIKQVLKTSKTVAVLGAHHTESKPSHYVPKYLQANGFEILPVNPTFAGQVILEATVSESLSALPKPIDVVDVFRRSDALEGHLKDILAMKPLPKVVWFQQGISNDKVAKTLSDEGIDVIQNRCMLADHQYLL